MKQQAFSLFEQGNINEAKRLCIQLTTNDTNDPEIWYLLGLINARQSNFNEAESQLLKAISYRSSPQIFLALGQVCLCLKKTNEAINYFQEIVITQPESHDAHSGLAQAYGLSNKLNKAIYHYEKIISLGSSNADIYGNIASLYQRLRNNNKAEWAAKKSLEYNPNHITGSLILARIQRSKKDFFPAIKQLQKVLDTYDHPSVISSISIEMGHSLNQAGHYNEAFSAFERGNQAWEEISKDAPFDKSYYLQKIKRNKDWFTQEKNSSSLRHKNTSLINLVFFVGFPRSGTTLLEQILSTDANIVTTAEEPLITDLINSAIKISGRNNFPDLLDNLSDKQIVQLQTEYISRLIKLTNRNKDNTTYVDKLPLNSIDVGFINKLFPEAKIIMAYRDPRDVCLSCFMQDFTLNPATLHFLTLEDTAKFYAQTMDLWLHYKSLLNINLLEYKYEDIVNDMESTIKTIVKFIGRPWTEEMKRFHEHAASKRIDTPSFADVASPIYNRAVHQWENYKSEISKIHDILEPYINKFEYK